MLLSLIYTELVKYKRTAVIWMIVIGGFFSAGTGYLLVSSQNEKVGWETYSTTGFNCINQLALLLTAVFTGYVIAGEYERGTISTIFTYPVSRIKLLSVKYLVILIFTAALYIIFFASMLLFGVLNIGEFPELELLFKLIKFSIIMVGINFVLSPVTAIISLALKGVATYLFAGMGYFIIYISFTNSEYSYLIPPCIPSKLIENFFFSEYLTQSDIYGIFLVSTITFLTALVISNFYYLKSDCR